MQLALSRVFRQAVAAVQERHPGKPFGAGMTVLDGKTGDVLALATYPLAAELGKKSCRSTTSASGCAC